MTTKKNKTAVALGRLSAKKRTKKQRVALAKAGGIASAKKHSKKQRRAIALKGWATRKKKAKETNLSPAGDGHTRSKAGKLSSNMEDVAKRIGLSKRGRDVYQKLVKQSVAMEV